MALHALQLLQQPKNGPSSVEAVPTRACPGLIRPLTKPSSITSVIEQSKALVWQPIAARPMLDILSCSADLGRFRSYTRVSGSLEVSICVVMLSAR